MALIPCYECEKEISDQAPACPHCGAPKEALPPQTRESPLRKMSLATLHKQDPALWEERFGEHLQSGLFKTRPELYWAQVILRELESEGIPMQGAYEKQLALASIIPRMQGVEFPSYEELMKMDLNPPSS
jgi:hypothetical protein